MADDKAAQGMAEDAPGATDAVAASGAPSDWLPDERISWFPIPQEADLDPRVADLVARQRAKLGAPNNVVRTHAWRAEIMLRWLELQDYITKGPSALSRVDREMIAVVVSAENRCLF
jgi:alkylhydroperoxidase family enzyme